MDRNFAFCPASPSGRLTIIICARSTRSFNAFTNISSRPAWPIAPCWFLSATTVKHLGNIPRVWAHTFGFNSEMFRIPMLFWQPKLVSPQVIKFPTSHVDVTPTLLDILGFPYDESRFQGESVLRGTPRRKYIFTMDAHGEYISAINPQMDKVIIGFHQNYFAAFNLAKDPGEKFPLDEKRFWPQAEAIIKFRNYQSRMIENYNQAILAGHPFPPKDHSHSGEKQESAAP